MKNNYFGKEILDYYEFDDYSEIFYKKTYSNSKLFNRACKEGNNELIEHFIPHGNLNRGLYCACQSSNLDSVKLLIKYGATDWNWGLAGACKGGNAEIIKFIIECGATDWNWGMAGACRSGKIELIHDMIKRGATNWNEGLRWACKGNHRDAINLMIKMGATSI